MKQSVPNLMDYPHVIHPVYRDEGVPEAHGQYVKRSGDKGIVTVWRFGPDGSVPAGYSGENVVVAMPSALKDEAYAKCPGGLIRSKLDGSECICVQLGNPPPPPFVVPCPECVSQLREQSSNSA